VFTLLTCFPFQHLSFSCFKNIGWLSMEPFVYRTTCHWCLSKHRHDLCEEFTGHVAQHEGYRSAPVNAATIFNGQDVYSQNWPKERYVEQTPFRRQKYIVDMPWITSQKFYQTPMVQNREIVINYMTYITQSVRGWDSIHVLTILLIKYALFILVKFV